jgi:hypothetical protein
MKVKAMMASSALAPYQRGSRDEAPALLQVEAPEQARQQQQRDSRR